MTTLQIHAPARDLASSRPQKEILCLPAGPQIAACGRNDSCSA